MEFSDGSQGKKKICIIAFVFQKVAKTVKFQYQEYIPLYAYSVFRAYPDYDLRVYLDGTLLPHVKEALGPVEKMGSVTIIENYSTPGLDTSKDFSGNLGKGGRCLLYDEAFSRYDAIYVGDMDVYICKESEGLYEAHIRHCEYLNLPYSNYVRDKDKIKKKNMSREYLKRCRKLYGLNKTLQYCLMDFSERFRMTGWHFMRTKPYYEKVLPQIPKMIHELNKMNRFYPSYWNPCARLYNEHILYRLVGMSGLPYPGEISRDGKLGRVIAQDDEFLKYRPHHGIHIGAYRTDNFTTEDKMLSSAEYLRHYAQLFEAEREDSVFGELLKLPLVRDAVDKIHAYVERNNLTETAARAAE